MKKVLFLVTMLITMFSAKSQVNIPPRDIHYNVHYHWGLIDVMIAHGVVTIGTDGDTFHATLDGTSIPWEGRVILVSDTLKAQMNPGNGLSKENVVYQSGWYRRPKASDFSSSRYNPDDPAYFKNIAGQGQYSASDDTMEAITVTSDMLGMYYYAQQLDFENMTQGQKVNIPIEGGYANGVEVTYLGKSVYNANGVSYPVYDLEFEYNYDGRPSGYEVQCKVGATDRLPLYLSASLPVGKVEMLYIEE